MGPKQKLNVQRAFNEHFRSFFILYDLKYLLTTPPADSTSSSSNQEEDSSSSSSSAIAAAAKKELVWDTDLRKGFLHGFHMLAEILSWMQGMDEQTRQVDQDVTYEMEWRSAFTLHLELAPPIALMLQWYVYGRVQNHHFQEKRLLRESGFLNIFNAHKFVQSWPQFAHVLNRLESGFSNKFVFKQNLLQIAQS